MTRWVIALVLAMAPAMAWAQSAPATPTTSTPAQQASTATQKALTAAANATKLVSEKSSAQAALKARYDGELKVVDRLKQQRASWRRDRELRSQLATATETAKELAALDKELAAAKTKLAVAKKQLVAAIDAELTAGASNARAQQLAKIRSQYAPAARKVKKIVLPETEIDPLADPEELDQQALALKEAEAELGRQVKQLEAQAAELERRAGLRKEHDRTKEVANRDDDLPRRGNTGSSSGGGREAADDQQPTAGPEDANGGPPADPATPQSESFNESDVRVELAEVVDATTMESLDRAQRSGDPATRAKAAKAAKESVAKQLERLKKKRQEIEARAKQLRKQ